jgi:thiol-disulfide isomerase/thioredoxin
MKKFIITLALFLMTTTAVQAAELIMFSMASCGYCQKFLKEVAPTYADSDAAKLLPLRIISMDRKDAPKWFDQAYDKGKIDGIIGTPTFIVFDNGEEKARLIGYQGKGRFYDDINNFVDSNRIHLEKSAGKSPIPFEEDTELDYKTALIQEEKKVMHEGSHNKTEEKVMPHQGKKLPNGVINSSDLMDHIYQTLEEAQIASLWLGCEGTHFHEAPDGDGGIYMPCAIMK